MATPWEFHAALLPICFEDRQVGSDTVGTTAKVGRPVLAEYADDAERRRFLEALLKLPWLPPEVRRAITRSLGRSLRAVKVGIGRARTMALRHVVGEIEARMRENGERPPKGDIRTAAIEEAAETAGLSSDALAKRIQRLKQ